MFVTPLLGRGPTTRRRWVALALFLGGAFQITLAIPPWETPSPLFRWLTAGLGLFWISLGVGIECAREWARRCCGFVAVIYFAWFLPGTVISIGSFGLPMSVGSGIFYLGFLLSVAIPAVIAIYCFLPSTRKHFAEVREAMARARAVPG